MSNSAPNPPYMTISPLYDVIHYTNHIFSESWWYPLFTDSLPTHPSPTQTHHTHITHPQPTYYDNISTLSCSTVYKSYIFSKLVIPTTPWLWPTVMMLIFYNTVVQQGRVFPVLGFSKRPCWFARFPLKNTLVIDKYCQGICFFESFDDTLYLCKTSLKNKDLYF